MIVQRARERAGGPAGYASRERVGAARPGKEAAPAAPPERSAGAKGAGAGGVGAGREEQAPRRVKSLAAVAAASVAVALVATAYGTWAVLSAQAAVDAAGADARPTLVAAADVRAGEVLDASSLEVRPVPNALRVGTALDGAALEGASSLLGQRALVDLPAGTQITPASVTGRADGSHLSAALAAGTQAVTVAVDAESGLAGQLRPSDHVRVVALEGAASGEAVLTTICDAVRVVALDGDRVGGDGAYASVTLEVSAEQADAVRAAQWAGKVSLVLMPALAQPDPGAGGVSAGGSEAAPGAGSSPEQGGVDG